jgi:hypothetical protein
MTSRATRVGLLLLTAPIGQETRLMLLCQINKGA